MPRINTRQAGAAVQIPRFGGIDRRVPSATQGGERAGCPVYDLCNLRPGADGSLTRRCGFGRRLTLPAAVRGVWSGNLNGERLLLAAAGSQLYRLEMDAGSYTALGSIAAGEGKVCIFLYRGLIYLLDGVHIYTWNGSALAEAQPYVPLVALERHPLDSYNIHEPINLLTRKVRFSFRVEASNANYYFGCKLTSIQSVYNAGTGMLLSSSYYSLKTDGYGQSYMSYTQSLTVGTIILVFATLDSSYAGYSRIAACTEAVVYGGAYDDRILCYGGQVRSEMFASRPVTGTQVLNARYRGAACGDLYFPADGCFRVGDGRYDVRAVCRHYDRLLVFTEGDAWMADFTASAARQFPVAPINSGVGCTSAGGAALAGNSPLSVAGGAIWRWSSSALRRDECSATCISDGIAPLIGAGFGERALAFSCRARDEVWFADPADVSGQVLIYRVGLDAWYRFTGVQADGFFAWAEDVGFWRGSSFYCFDETREQDLDGDEAVDIPFSLTLDGLDFGQRLRESRLCRMAMLLRGAHGPLTLTLGTDRGQVRSLALAAGEASIFDCPLRSGRGRTIRFGLSGAGGARFCLCALTLCAAERPNP